jgi:uncharacterized protein (TIRG00374 family)
MQPAPATRFTLVRSAAPLLVSAAALAGLYWFVDLKDLREIASRLRWDELPTVLLIMLLIVFASAWRWRTLLREALSWRKTALVTAIGLAGNQLLPLRGGDAMRVVLSARGRTGTASIHAGVSALALEKVFDLLAVAALGLAAVLTLVGGRSAALESQVFAMAVVIIAGAGLLLAAARTAVPVRLLRKLARMLRVKPRLYRHLLRPIHHLRLVSTPVRLLAVLLQTAVIWLVLYALVYIAIGRLVSVPLGLSDVMLLLFAGALGLALPAAPSGVGTFHAAVVSAFVLLDRPVAEGLALAITAHAVFFTSLCAIGAIALGIAARSLGPIKLKETTVE